MSATKDDGRKVVAENRRARHEFFLTDTYEAGLVLTGTEVKSLRKGQANIAESYASAEDGGLWLINSHIPEYQGAGRFFQHEPRRKRRLLLHKREIEKLGTRAQERGLTILPLRAYLKNGRVKVEIGLARGKRAHDKREAIKKKDQEREARQAMGRRR